MAAANNQGGKTADIEAQMQQVREDIAVLTRLIAEVAGAETGEAKDMALEQAAKLVRTSKAKVDAAQQRVGKTFSSIEQHIEEKPVQSAVIALLAGMFIGWLSRR